MQPGPAVSQQDLIAYAQKVLDFWAMSRTDGVLVYSEYRPEKNLFYVNAYFIVCDQNHRADFEVSLAGLWDCPLAELTSLDRKIDAEREYLSLGGYFLRPEHHHVDERILKQNQAFREKFL
jgi:hypothetical protein